MKWIVKKERVQNAPFCLARSGSCGFLIIVIEHVAQKVYCAHEVAAK